MASNSNRDLSAVVAVVGGLILFRFGVNLSRWLLGPHGVGKVPQVETFSDIAVWTLAETLSYFSIGALLFMLVWNTAVVRVFQVEKIGWLQAVSLCMLASVVIFMA